MPALASIAILILLALPARATDWLPERNLTITPTIPGGEPVGKIDVPGAPEPATGLLIASAAFLLLGRRRG